MALRERLLETNRDDFRPLEKAVEIIVALHENGIFAYPEEEWRTKEDGHITESVTFRLFRQGEIAQSSGLMLIFEHMANRERLKAYSGIKEPLVLIGKCLEIEIDKGKLNALPTLRFNHMYEVEFDLQNAAVIKMGPKYD
jgi:hypothetical protein